MSEEAVRESNVVAEKKGVQTEEPLLETRIRIRAYELYEQRRGEGGDPDDDWFRAEEEVKGQGTQASK